MLTKLFSSEARIAILKLFLFNSGKAFYLRQISSLANQPIQAVQREVNKLVEIGLISKFTEGNRTYYQADKTCTIFEELKRIFLKTLGFAEVLKEHLTKSDDIKVAFIYGSYAKGKENLSSDIDLFIIGKISSKTLSSILSKPKKELGREVNYIIFSPIELSKKLKQKNHFINTVLKEDKLFIIGNENDLKAIIGTRKNSAT